MKRWVAVSLVPAMLWAPGAFAAPRGKTPGISITAPATATVGQQISITVSPVNGASLASVMLLTDRDHTSQVKDAPPWSFTYTVEASVVGTLTISAMASDTASDAIYTASTVVQIGTSATLTSLVLRLGTDVKGNLMKGLSMNYYGEVEYLPIQGTFSDGVVRDLSSLASGTTYQSQNTAIVAVTADGGLQAVANGTTDVIVSNSGRSLTVPVTVQFVNPTRGDLMGGTGTNADLALTYSGPVLAGTASLPLTSGTFSLPSNVPQISFIFHNNAGLPQLGVASGVVTAKLAKASNSNCSVSFTNNILPPDVPPFGVIDGTVTIALPTGGGKCVVSLNIVGASDNIADKFTITNPAP